MCFANKLLPPACVVISAWVAGCALCARGASFQGLGGANVQGVSTDGLYVVGSRSTTNGPEAFRWTAAGGMVGLGAFPSSTPNSQGVAVSSNGAVAVGHSLRTNGFEALRWTEAGGMVGLGDFFQNDFQSAAYAVSAEGSVVVGYGYSASGPEGFWWTPGGGMVGLGAPNQDRFESRASGVSADGTIVVGYAFYPDSGVNGLFQPFRWTQAGGMVKLGDLPTGVLTTYAPAVLISGNGGVVAGNGFFPTEPFMWNAGHGIRNLLDSNSWTTITNGPIVLGGRIKVAEPVSGTERFYRLKWPWVAAGQV